MMYRWKVRSSCTGAFGTWSATDSVFVASEVNDVGNMSGVNLMLVHPNPATDRVRATLLADLTPGIELHIYNTLGECMSSREIANDSAIDFDVSNFTEGLYFIKVRVGSLLMTSPLVIRR